VQRIAMCRCGARRCLGLDGGEVLDVVAEDAAQVLDEPVEQRSEVQRIPRGPLVVVAVWVDGCAVLADLAVARAGERDEHRRAEHGKPKSTNGPRAAYRCIPAGHVWPTSLPAPSASTPTRYPAYPRGQSSTATPTT